jgi:hypothetical protein
MSKVLPGHIMKATGVIFFLGGGAWGKMPPSNIFFLPQNSFFATELEGKNKKWGQSGVYKPIFPILRK